MFGVVAFARAGAELCQRWICYRSMSSPSRYMIYGANGYTGQLLARRARDLGHNPVLAGRNRGAIEPLANELGFDFSIFDLTVPQNVARGLGHVDAVLHAAGPFVETSQPMLEACLATATHYVDITGEIDVFEACAARSADAAAAGVMVLPGAGFDVVPSDCLAKFVCEQVESPMHLAIGIVGLGYMSRGTMRTAARQLGRKTRVRRGGRVIELPKPLHRKFDFGGAIVETVAASWGDVVTAYYSTGVPDIEVYFHLTRRLAMLGRIPPFLGGVLATPPVQNFLRARIRQMPPGPGEQERKSGTSLLMAEVVDSARNTCVARLTAPEAYSLTVETSLKIIENVLAGNFKPGFQTPSLAYGADFILQFADVEREVMAKP